MALNEEKVRERVGQLKAFYKTLYSVGIVCSVCIIAWMFFSGDSFWPKWVILGCAIYAGIQAFKSGLVPVADDFFPFLKPGWENEQVKQIMSVQQAEPTAKQPVATASRVTISTSKAKIVTPKTVKKPVATVTKKPASAAVKKILNKPAAIAKVTKKATTVSKKTATVSKTASKKPAVQATAKSSKAKAKLALSGGVKKNS